MGIPASQRLTKRSDFERVRRSEQRVHCAAFVVQCRAATDRERALPCLGVIASRRVGNAVKRNRGKRLIRELFRLEAGELLPGSHYVVVLRSGFDRYTFAELLEQFRGAHRKIRGAVERQSSQL